MKEGWATWEEEKPDWFTDGWRAKVPEDMLPTKEIGAHEDRSLELVEVHTDLIVRVRGEDQSVRRKSVTEFITGKKTSKISPSGGINEEIDEDEFVRQMKRRGSMNM